MDSSTEIVDPNADVTQDTYLITNCRAELDGVPNQMAFMLSFSYKDASMWNNDTSVVGDQQQTDICHVDAYGTHTDVQRECMLKEFDEDW